MDKSNLEKLEIDVLAKHGKERESYRMSFQTSPEIVKMIEKAAESEGKRGVLKDALENWLTAFDNLLTDTAIDPLKNVLNKKLEKPLLEIANEIVSDDEEGAKAGALFSLLSVPFKNGSDLIATLTIEDKTNKTYTLSYRAKKSLITITKKISINKSDCFNLVVNTFCKYSFDYKKKKELEVISQAEAVWPFIDSFSDQASDALSKLQEIHESNYEIFDTEISITELAMESDLDTDTEIEKAIGLISRAIYQIQEAAGIVSKEINKKESTKK